MENGGAPPRAYAEPGANRPERRKAELPPLQVPDHARLTIPARRHLVAAHLHSEAVFGTVSNSRREGLTVPLYIRTVDDLKAGDPCVQRVQFKRSQSRRRR